MYVPGRRSEGVFDSPKCTEGKLHLSGFLAFFEVGYVDSVDYLFIFKQKKKNRTEIK